MVLMDIFVYTLLALFVTVVFFVVVRMFLFSKQQDLPNITSGNRDNELEGENSNPQLDFTEARQKELIDLARRSIENFIKSGHFIDYESNDLVLNQTCGVFITLRKGEALRGCIGQMWADTPLYQTVKDTAISAATRDPRFPPVSEVELDELSIKISILSPLDLVEDVSEIEVGKHGLMIMYAGRRGVLLPQVPVERGWDRVTFLENLCVKAGLLPDTWKENPEIYSFTTLDFGEE
jgi:AmmeMemoRadiSam system protein A